MQTVIGLVGANRSGKSEFIKIFSELAVPRSVKRISSGELLAKLAKLAGIEASRKNLQNFAIALDKEFGDGTLSNAVRIGIHEAKSDVIFFDGVRWLTDEKMLRNLDTKFYRTIIVHLQADQGVRWQRALLSGEKVGEEGISFEQFAKEDGAGTETLVSDIGSRADFVITNNGTQRDLRAQIIKFFRTYF